MNRLYLGWGVGSLGTITMINSIAALYLFFLVSVIGLDPVLAGTLIFASKLVDVISDPLMGWLSDRTNTRWGRRRPYMAGASVLCGLSMGLLFTLPDIASNTLLATWILVLLVVYTLALTAFNVPYLAMPAEMTDDYHERSRIMAYRAFFLVSGSFMGTAGSGLLLNAWGRDASAYASVGWILGGIVVFAMLASAIGTRRARQTRYKPVSIPLANQVRLVFLNRPFLILGSIKAMQFLQLASTTTVTLFFFATVYGLAEELLFPFGAAITAGSILGLKMWLVILARTDKRTMFVMALILNSLGFLSWLAADAGDPLWMLVLRAGYLGLCAGGIIMCSQSMITDVIDYDRRLSGINREGIFSATFSFIEKTTYALGPLIIGLLLAAFGYDASIPRGEPQPEGARLAVMLGMVWIPVACTLGQLIMLRAYRLDEQTLTSAGRHSLGQE